MDEDGLNEAQKAEAQALLDELAALHAERARMDARENTINARLVMIATESTGSNSRSQDLAVRSMAREIGCRLLVSHLTVQSWFNRALQLVGSFPTLLAAQARGDVTLQQARAIVAEGQPLETSEVSQLQRDAYVATAIQAAKGRAPGKLKLILRRAVERFTTDPITDRHALAIADRTVRLTDVEDGMAYLTAYLPAAEAHLIYNRLQYAALSRCTEDPRTAAQWRADALSVILRRGYAPDEVHDHCDDPNCVPTMLRGAKAKIVVTVPANMLLTGDESEPAMIDGETPIPATSVAALIAANTDAIERWITHPVSGQVIAVDRRFANAQLTRQILARDGGRCQFPTCASRDKLQLDHTIQWSKGGTTSAANLEVLCASCHTVKDFSRWQVFRDEDDVFHWISPLAHDYSEPPSLVVLT